MFDRSDDQDRSSTFTIDDHIGVFGTFKSADVPSTTYGAYHYFYFTK